MHLTILSRKAGIYTTRRLAQAARLRGSRVRILDPLQVESKITARTREDSNIMGLRHRTAPIEGVQFHPESVLSEHGHRLLGNWLASCAATV